MTAFEFLKSRTFFIQLGILLLAAIFFIWVLLLCLGIITKHGEAINVPTIKGLTINKARLLLDERDLKIAIMDSTFVLGKKPGEILEQDPKPYTLVKSDRKIYVSIQVICPPEIKMPNLKDNSMRQAILLLKSYGLSMGKIIYKPDYASNAVLDMLYNGKPIKPGNKIRKGSLIDLVVANGLGSDQIPVPMLKGLTYDEAKILIQESGLTVGLTIWDADITDSTNAVIWNQAPEMYNEIGEYKYIRLGETIDIFLTNNAEKIAEIDTMPKPRTANISSGTVLEPTKRDENETDEK